MREVAALVDNEKDFNTHILAQASKVPAASPDIKYERHPVRNLQVGMRTLLTTPGTCSHSRSATGATTKNA